jgi:hypothetical protein
MNLKEHYKTLYLDSIEQIASGKYELDDQIDAVVDKRQGLTLLIRVC